eukprot:6173314-Pleurochrysis_carterae.AAC.3
MEAVIETIVQRYLVHIFGCEPPGRNSRLLGSCREWRRGAQVRTRPSSRRLTRSDAAHRCGAAASKTQPK